jgi:CMP-2-keto-3-deoxyoctulosonic acid synthetase
MTFVKGDPRINRRGRPRKAKVQELEKALKKVEEKRGLSLIEHCVRRAYSSEKMAIAILNKLLPDHLKGEGFAASFTAISINRSSDRQIRSRLTRESV